MRTSYKVLLGVTVGALLALNIHLGTACLQAIRENSRLKSRVNDLRNEEEKARLEFVLKQDHMRTILTDQEFAEQLYRDKEGYIRKGKMIVKFED